MNTLKCPVCNATDTVNVLEITGVPVHCNVLYHTVAEATAALTGSMKLAYCKHCSHLYNSEFDPAKMQYTHEYENSLHFSKRFQEYAENLAARLVDTYDIRDKSVIEIGCGKGDFLKLVCDAGNNKGIGFDKSYDPANAEAPESITFIQDFYSEQYSDVKADLLCCRHVLEHIQYPVEFLKSINSIVKNKEDMTIFFEVPNSLYTVKDLGIWDLIYEHCSYFSLYSLTKVFEQVGFTVINRNEAFNGQFISLEAKPAGDKTGISDDDRKKVDGLLPMITDFSARYHEKISKWQKVLTDLKEAGEKAVIWGAGSKGVTFLNIFKDFDVIEYAVDINPRKTGMFIPGTGQKIILPEELKNIPIRCIFIMNPNYEDEIKASVKELGLGPNFIAV